MSIFPHVPFAFFSSLLGELLHLMVCSHLQRKVAEITGGIYTHIDDGDGNLATAMSSFYLYYAYGLQTEEITVSTPFISFSSGKLTVTLSKPVYVDNSFVGTSPPCLPP